MINKQRKNHRALLAFGIFLMLISLPMFVIIASDGKYGFQIQLWRLGNTKTILPVVIVLIGVSIVYRYIKALRKE